MDCCVGQWLIDDGKMDPQWMIIGDKVDGLLWMNK